MLTDTGKDFSWDDIKGPKIDFVECSTEENSDLSLEPIKKWISKF
jgi:hypothetical protein